MVMISWTDCVKLASVKGVVLTFSLVLVCATEATLCVSRMILLLHGARLMVGHRVEHVHALLLGATTGSKWACRMMHHVKHPKGVRIGKHERRAPKRFRHR